MEKHLKKFSAARLHFGSDSLNKQSKKPFGSKPVLLGLKA
jgi:hypothetical protein